MKKECRASLGIGCAKAQLDVVSWARGHHQVARQGQGAEPGVQTRPSLGFYLSLLAKQETWTRVPSGSLTAQPTASPSWSCLGMTRTSL